MATFTSIFTWMISSSMFVTNILPASHAYQWPTITMISTELEVKNGASRQFFCNTTNEVTLLGLTWTFNKEPIAYYYIGNPRMMYADGYSAIDYIVTINEIQGHVSSSLGIRNVDHNRHDGSYCCEFWVMGGYSETQCIENQVSVLPHEVTLFINGKNATDSKFSIDLRKEYTFMVTVNGSKPAADISWTLGGIPVDGDQEDTPNQVDHRFLDSANTLGPLTLSELTNLRCSIKIPGDTAIEKYIDFIPEMPLTIKEKEIRDINISVALFLLIVVASLALMVGLICFAVAMMCSKTKKNGN